jgi:hypothetical protein
MEQILTSLIPADRLIHMTVAYSNALLMVVMSNVSDFARKLDLPIPQPVIEAQVQKFLPHPIKDYVGGVLTLTNGDRFWFAGGHVGSYRAYKNANMPPDEFEYGDDDRLYGWLSTMYGPVNMTTNEMVEFARESLRKLGYDPKALHADGPPTLFDGPYKARGNSVPFCRVEWTDEEGTNFITFDINTQRKRVARLSLAGNYFIRPNPKLDIEPELERDFRKRTGAKMFIRTNGPVRPPTGLSPPSSPQQSNK